VSSATGAADAARVTVMVAAPPAVAFEVFTQEIDLWWRRGPRFRSLSSKSLKTPGILHFEGKVGGRLFESSGDGPGETLVVMGRITVWDPPSRLVFEWRNKTFTEQEHTTVEVQFKETHGKTEVTVEHRGWGALRADHPARHGLAGPAFSRSLGMFWGDLMSSMREHVASNRA
jgi:uncharacterized protein YndB with AHSA1/START domain